MKQPESIKEYTIKSLNFSGISVLKLEKEKDRVEYEAVAIQLIAEDMFDKSCNMQETCYPNAPQPCSGKVPEPPPPPPCPHTPPPPPCPHTPPPPPPPGGQPGGGGGGT